MRARPSFQLGQDNIAGDYTPLWHEPPSEGSVLPAPLQQLARGTLFRRQNADAVLRS